MLRALKGLRCQVTFLAKPRETSMTVCLNRSLVRNNGAWKSDATRPVSPGEFMAGPAHSCGLAAEVAVSEGRWQPPAPSKPPCLLGVGCTPAYL